PVESFAPCVLFSPSEPAILDVPFYFWKNTLKPLCLLRFIHPLVVKSGYIKEARRKQGSEK
ncbi:MAG: hypothetical protein IJP78_12355, partial [Clostridia bacterium]|nr:hypothetical protein [Clostridia bacterium]